MTTIKVYRNRTDIIGQIFEIVPAAGVTAYRVFCDRTRDYLAVDIPVASGTTSLKFFVDSIFSGEIWFDSTVERLDELSLYPNVPPDSARVAIIDLPATGGGGTDLGGGGIPEAPINGQLYGRKDAAWSAVPVSGGGLPGYINVMDYGARGIRRWDDTVAIQAAVDATKATIDVEGWGSKGLYFPPGAYVCSAPIDFRGISTVKCDGWLVYEGTPTDICFKFGQPSNNGGGSYSFFGFYVLRQNYATMRYPLAQFAGLRGARVDVGVCNGFIEVAGIPGDYKSSLYSEIHIGQTFRLEVRGSQGPDSDGSSGHVNSCQFYGGALAQLRIGGPWIDVVGTPATPGIIETAIPHGFVVGNLVEMYNGNIDEMVFGLVTAVGDATHFTLPGTYAGTGWRCMGPSGYAHNDNAFYCPDIEDFPAIVHINNGHNNRLIGCRMEANGPLLFGPDSYSNTVEQSNTTHGAPPDLGQGISMTVHDFSGGKNFTGWTRIPKGYGVG